MHHKEEFEKRSSLAPTKVAPLMATAMKSVVVVLPGCSTWAVRKSVVARKGARRNKAASSACLE